METLQVIICNFLHTKISKKSCVFEELLDLVYKITELMNLRLVIIPRHASYAAKIKKKAHSFRSEDNCLIISVKFCNKCSLFALQIYCAAPSLRSKILNPNVHCMSSGTTHALDPPLMYRSSGFVGPTFQVCAQRAVRQAGPTEPCISGGGLGSLMLPLMPCNVRV